MTVQEWLDQLLEENSDWQQYIEKLTYLPEGSAVPDGTTQILAITSAKTTERQLVVACELVPQYAAYMEALLALIATSPDAEIPEPPPEG
jgi:hypothetical protein